MALTDDLPFTQEGACVDTTQFEVLDGVIAPQPWMQLRQVATAQHAGSSAYLDSSGGSAKNDLVHAVQVGWTNNTPITQYVYGLVTSGGMQVALQARSRGYLLYKHGFVVDDNPTAGDFPMVTASKFGGGADIGQGGLLAVGTGFCVHDVRAPSSTINFMPGITGWFPVAPGERFNARAELWFTSEFWENGAIDGGDQGTESMYMTEGTRLDLFAVPVIDPPVFRSAPVLVGMTTAWEGGPTIDADVPAGTQEDDLLLAVFCTNLGSADDMEPDDVDWEYVQSVSGNNLIGFNPHCKVYKRIATDDEPVDYTFNFAAIGVEGQLLLIAIRGVDHDEGIDIGLEFTRPNWLSFLPRKHAIPSLVSYKKFLVGFSFTTQLGQIAQTVPAGMTEGTDIVGNATSLSAAYLRNPPTPTGRRQFISDRAPTISAGGITGTIVVTGHVSDPDAPDGGVGSGTPYPSTGLYPSTVLYPGV